MSVVSRVVGEVDRSARSDMLLLVLFVDLLVVGSCVFVYCVCVLMVFVFECYVVCIFVCYDRVRVSFCGVWILCAPVLMT